MGLALIMGFATAFNILVIFKKLELKRYQDAFFDTSFLIILTLVFAGSIAGMMIGTVASAVVSVYFFFNTPKFLSFDFKKLYDELNSDEDDDEVSDNVSTVNSILKEYNLRKVELV